MARIYGDLRASSNHHTGNLLSYKNNNSFFDCPSVVYQSACCITVVSCIEISLSFLRFQPVLWQFSILEMNAHVSLPVTSLCGLSSKQLWLSAYLFTGDKVIAQQQLTYRRKVPSFSIVMSPRHCVCYINGKKFRTLIFSDI